MEQPIDIQSGTASASDAVLSDIFDGTAGAQIRAALVGRGILGSLTPRMHMSEGARLGLRYVYRLIDFDDVGRLGQGDLPALIRAAAARGFAGLNVTHPFKQSVIRHLDELSAEAAAIGAVNTIVFAEGKAIGHNTDCWGFAESFRSKLQGSDLGRVLLLGAGGAGRAVAQALCDLGADEIAVFDLDSERAAGLVEAIESAPGSCRAVVAHELLNAARSATGIVNATPIGMAKYPGTPIPVELLRPHLWVADVVYFPAETNLIKAAADKGCRIMAGKGMAVFQAVRAFELITGRRPNPQQMFRHFESASHEAIGAD